MAIPVWPATLPQEPLAEAYEEQLGGGVMRTPMADGAAKIRFTSKPPTPAQIQMWMTAAQVETFEEFGETTLLRWTRRFSWVHHRRTTAVEIECRIVVDENRKVSVRAANGLYMVSFLVEILP